MSISWERIGLVLLGAGLSQRFGSDKLSALLNGMSVMCRSGSIYTAIPLAERVLVRGSQSPSLAGLGFAEIVTAGPTIQSQSLALGLRALLLDELDAVLVALADMPLVTNAHLESLRQRFNGTSVVCSLCGVVRSPPALFPVAMLDALLAQQGDKGGRKLLDEGVAVESAPDILRDIDTLADFELAERILTARGAQVP